MPLRFQSDADLNPQVVYGLRRREPAIDFLTAMESIPLGTPDPVVLAIAARDGRVLVTRDVSTMFGHFSDFIQNYESPGVIAIPHGRSLGAIIESLLEVWSTWAPEVMHNRIRWLP